VGVLVKELVSGGPMMISDSCHKKSTGVANLLGIARTNIPRAGNRDPANTSSWTVLQVLA
jgi:hypothetical protein